MASPRPWLAAVLAAFYPGLGHAYARSWSRALLWFVLAVGAAVIVIPSTVFEGAFPLSDTGALLALGEAVRAETSTLGLASLGIVVAFSVIDAYAIAQGTRQRRRTAEAGTQCPECGRELDDDLSFCHWCTTRLDEKAE